jgi:hypothetical protein
VERKIQALFNTITCAYLLAHRSCLEGVRRNCRRGWVSSIRHVTTAPRADSKTLRHLTSMRQGNTPISEIHLDDF